VTPGEAHERALKAAETDATKRALVTFGSRFGLMLYDRERRTGAMSESRATFDVSPSLASPATRAPDDSALPTISAAADGASTLAATSSVAVGSSSQSAVDKAVAGPSSLPATSEVAVTDGPRDTRDGKALIASDGTAIEVLSPEGFCTALRQLIVAARSPDELARLRWNNQPVLSQLRSLPQLVTPQGRHYADLLEQMIAKRLVQFARQDRESPSSTQESGGSRPEVTERPDAIAVPIAPRELTRPFVPVPRYPLSELREIIAASSARGADAPPVTASSPTPPTDVSTSVDVGQTSVLPTRRSQITGGFVIDKSTLALPTERRLRSKAHRMFVASQPCLICSSQPCHAHHITFAQPRGLSQKVSDEFVVPLCVSHHNELHAAHNEASWWRSHGIEPLPVAQKLWAETWGNPFVLNKETTDEISSPPVGTTMPRS
jgi:hypothetical protein